MFDRLGLVTARLKNADPKSVESQHIDGLRDMRVGLNIAAIREAAPEHAGAHAATAQPTAYRAPELDSLLSLIAATYTARANNTEEPSATALEHAIDAGIGALVTQGLPATADAPPNTPAPATPTSTRRYVTSLAALTALRLDLAPASAPYTQTAPAT
jgi:hypothetical protein